MSTSPLIRAAYLGPPASYSHQAAINFFSLASAQSFLTTSPTSTEKPKPTNIDVDLKPHATFTDIFTAVQSSSVTYGVVPFENSSNGSVVQLLDLLADREGLYSDVKVVAEYYLRVRHCLLVGRKARPKQNAGGKEDNVPSSAAGSEYAGITRLYTHPQAWGQCNAFLERYFNAVERVDVGSTSRAAELVSIEEDDPESTGCSAAIASKLAGEMRGLEVLKEGIEDQDDNVTRFFVLKRQDIPTMQPEGSTTVTTERQEPEDPHGAKYKSLISFTIDHGVPGALADALGIFKKHWFNLTSIDTRPSRVRPWHYVFFVECEQGERGGDALGIEGAMADLKQTVLSCRLLGRWRDELSGTGKG